MSKTIEDLKKKYLVVGECADEDPVISEAIAACLLVTRMELAKDDDSHEYTMAVEYAYEAGDAANFPQFDADPECVGDDDEMFEEHERAAAEALRACGYDDSTVFFEGTKTLEEGVRLTNAANFGNVGTWWEIFRVCHYG